MKILCYTFRTLHIMTFLKQQNINLPLGKICKGIFGGLLLWHAIVLLLLWFRLRLSFLLLGLLKPVKGKIKLYNYTFGSLVTN